MVVGIVDERDMRVAMYIDDVVGGTNAELVWQETLIVLQRLIKVGFMLKTKNSVFP